MHPKEAYRMANSVDPDQTALDQTVLQEQSDLRLLYLPRSVYRTTYDPYSIQLNN